MLTYTANVMSTLPNETKIRNSEVKLPDMTTTTLSPEEAANKFELADGTYFSGNI